MRLLLTNNLFNILFLLQWADSSTSPLNPFVVVFSSTQVAQDARMNQRAQALQAELRTSRETHAEEKAQLGKEIDNLENYLSVSRGIVSKLTEKLAISIAQNEGLKAELKSSHEEKDQVVVEKTRLNQRIQELLKKLEESKDQPLPPTAQKPAEDTASKKEVENLKSLYARLIADFRRLQGESEREKIKVKAREQELKARNLALIKERDEIQSNFEFLKKCTAISNLGVEFHQRLEELKFDEAEEIASRLKATFKIDTVSQFALIKAYYIRYVTPNPDYAAIKTLLEKVTETAYASASAMITNFALESLVAQNKLDDVRSFLETLQEMKNPDLAKWAKLYIDFCAIHKKPLVKKDQDWVKLAAGVVEPGNSNQPSVEEVQLSLQKKRFDQVFKSIAPFGWVLGQENVQSQVG